MQDLLVTPPETLETYEFLAREANATELAGQIEHDGQARGDDIATRVEKDANHPGVWYVEVEWWRDADTAEMLRVSSCAAWERYFAQQHAIIHYKAMLA